MKNVKILFLMITMLMLWTVSALSQNSNTLGAKVYISESTPRQFVDISSGYKSISVLYGDSVAWKKTRGGLSYDAIIHLDVSCDKATIYLWNDDSFEIWERPIEIEEKSLPRYYASNASLEGYLLSRINIFLITPSSTKMDEDKTQKLKKGLIGFKKNLKEPGFL